jgi:hypothetical protein
MTTAIGDALIAAAMGALVRGKVSAACRLVLEHVLGDRRQQPAVPVPEAARVGIKPVRGGFRITAFGLDFTVADLRVLAGHRVDNDETFSRRWRRTVTRAWQAHGEFGRQTLTGKGKAGDAINVTGFHSRAQSGANQKETGNG